MLMAVAAFVVHHITHKLDSWERSIRRQAKISIFIAMTSCNSLSAPQQLFVVFKLDVTTNFPCLGGGEEKVMALELFHETR